jgi:hypothetical protein
MENNETYLHGRIDPGRKNPLPDQFLIMTHPLAQTKLTFLLLLKTSYLRWSLSNQCLTRGSSRGGELSLGVIGGCETRARSFKKFAPISEGRVEHGYQSAIL